MKKYIGIIITFVFCLVSVIVTFNTVSNVDAYVNKLRDKDSMLLNEIQVKQSTLKSEVSKVLESATGLNMARTQKDDKIVKEFLKKVFTWKSYKEYMEIRSSIMKDYKLTEDSKFMKVFMPKIVNTKMAGKDYNRIDIFKYSMSFENMTSQVVNIAGTNYSYFTNVKVSSRDNEHKSEAFSEAIFTYTIDDTGKLSNIDAVPLVK